MTKRTRSLILAWAFFVGGRAFAVPLATIATAELERGDRGWGLSVFAGNEPERFEVEVLGVLGGYRADTDYILARLSGMGLERSGVVAGMSGSPVYFGDRLAGAVAWAWPFSQDAIAGITPIAAMRELTELPAAVATGAGTEPIELRSLAALDLPEGLLESSLELLRPPTLGEASAAPLWALNGFGEGSRALFSRALGSGVAAAGSRPDAVPAELVAGSAVAGVLVDGDLRLAVTGTVTERRGDEILAFGHPFLGSGALRLPMATAEIVTVVASRASSFKVSNVGTIVGAFEEDRAAGVRGRIGAEATMIPLTIRVAGPEARELRMRVSDLPLLAPGLIATSAFGALETVDRISGGQGLDMRAVWHLEGYAPLEIEQSFDGDSAALEAVRYLLAVGSFLTRNPMEAVRIERVEVDFETHPAPRTASLIAAHADRTRLRPGETVGVTLDLVAWQGEPFRQSVRIELPAELSAGTYYLLIGDGVSLDVARMTVERTQPVSFRQALDLLRSFHSRRELVALGLFADPGLAVAGEAMSQLPGSVRSLWGAAASQSSLPLALAVAQEEVVEMDLPILGAVRLDLEVLRREPLREGKSSENGPENTE